MANFLEEEIQLEKKDKQKPVSLKGFDITVDDAEVTFTSKANGEM